MSLNLLAIWSKHKIETQLIYNCRQAQVWEFVFQGLDIGKWNTEKHCDWVAGVKNVKTVMCQKGGTLSLTLVGSFARCVLLLSVLRMFSLAVLPVHQCCSLYPYSQCLDY